MQGFGRKAITFAFMVKAKKKETMCSDLAIILGDAYKNLQCVQICLQMKNTYHTLHGQFLICSLSISKINLKKKKKLRSVGTGSVCSITAMFSYSTIGSCTG